MSAPLPTPGPSYLDNAIERFKTDPPDSDFQDGYMAALHVMKAESGYPEMYEALAYARESLGDPIAIGRRHVARKIDPAIAKARGDA